MKKSSIPFFLACAVLLVGVTTSACADDATKLAKIEAIADASHFDQLISQVMDQVSAIANSQFKQLGLLEEDRPAAEELQKSMMALLADTLTVQRLRPMVVKTYSETFTEPELTSILEFYQTPGGQAYLQKMPALMQKTMVAVQDLMKDMQPEVNKIIQDFAKRYEPQ